MLCEKYKPALIEAAITGAELAPAIHAHVAACPSCAAELTQQRSLVAAIDANLHHQMNAPVPAAMLQRFEARIAQQTPSRSLNLRWLYATAALAATVAVILLAVPRLRTHKPNSPTAAQTQKSQSPTEHRPETTTLILQPATPEEIRRDRRQHSHRARTEPEVIVPPDERIAMENFIADLHGEGAIALARAKRVIEQREQPIVPVDTPDIQIASLKVPPIRDTDMSSDK
jgi:hypothetical protein